jgi:putative DNA primase/helicase
MMMANICLVRSGVTYDPNAKCPEFDKFLNDIFNGDQVKIEVLLSWIGAIIAGMEPQIIIMFKSRGRSGKGILMEVISGVLGNMMTMMSPNLLHARFSNWGFLHRRLIYLEEHDGRDATTKALKEVSGGCPCVNFETKGVQAIMQAAVQCAIIINTNNPPPYEKGSAWEERFKMIDFPNSYVDNSMEPWEKKIDYGIKRRLIQEIPGILNKLLPYAKYALDNPNKMFKKDITYKEIEDSLDKSTESLDSFINEHCELAPIKQDAYDNVKIQYTGYSVTDTTFMKRYEEYCSRPEINTRASASKYVKKALKQDHRVIINGHVLMGIRLIENRQEPNVNHEQKLDSFTVDT